jgi:questin oxidase-like protein
LLTIYALGATPEALTKAYKENADYQRPLNWPGKTAPPKNDPAPDLSDPTVYEQHLGKQEFYSSFVSFYANELETHGVEATLDKFLFANTDFAFQLFGRLFAGLLHPIIHLGFALEFEQPAILAEALAQTAVHENWVSAFFVEVEKAAQKYDGPEKSLEDIMKQLQEDKEVRNWVKWEDDNKFRDGILVRGREKMAAIVGQWKVKEDELEQKTREMLANVCECTRLNTCSKNNSTDMFKSVLFNGVPE